MTEFQEGRTYLVVLFYGAREVVIVTGELDGDLLDGDDNQVYESFAGPLTLAEYSEAQDLIGSRDALLNAAEQNVIIAGNLTRKLLAQWRELA